MDAITTSLILSTILGVCIALQTPAPALADVAPASPPPLPGSIDARPGWPAAKQTSDVDTVEHLVAALYDVISGPGGKPRDWDRFRSLFLPDARLGTIRPARAAKDNYPASAGDAVFRTPDVYIERNDPYFKTNGFFEREVANRTEEFGSLVHVWSTYESRRTMIDPAPFARGVNSLQIVRVRDRFWLASVIWDDEHAGSTLPDKYLHSQR
jgi:hypothetical protein